MTESFKYNGFKDGMDNIQLDHALGKDTLRNAVNVDVLDTGKIRRRRGFTKKYAGVHLHSLRAFSTFAVFVENSTLKKISPNYTTENLRGVGSNSHMGYTEINSELYFSNGVVSGRVQADGTVLELGVEDPSGQPTLTATTGGLAAGEYQVAVTFMTASGQESGSSAPAKITLATENSGIALSAIPQPVGAEATKINIYKSSAGGATLFLAASVAKGTTSAVLTSDRDAGRTLKTQLLKRMPAGDILEYYSGRLFSALGNLACYSEPLSYGLCNINNNFMLFSGPISVIKAVSDGLFIVADKTYFLPGAGSENGSLIVVAPYRAVKGTGINLPKSTDVAWLSERGPMVGSSGGAVKLLTEESMALTLGGTGAMMFREFNGGSHLVGTARNVDNSKLAAASFVDAEIVRNGRTI